MNIVSEGIPRWKSGGILYRLFFICMVAVFYPFTAVIRICAPESYVGRMAAKPLIKFINSVASFVTLLGKIDNLLIKTFFYYAFLGMTSINLKGCLLHSE